MQRDVRPEGEPTDTRPRPRAESYQPARSASREERMLALEETVLRLEEAVLRISQALESGGFRSTELRGPPPKARPEYAEIRMRSILLTGRHQARIGHRRVNIHRSMWEHHAVIGRFRGQTPTRVQTHKEYISHLCFHLHIKFRRTAFGTNLIYQRHYSK